MSVYPLGASGASCVCPGCLCCDQVPRYPSDLTDAQWEVLRPEAEQVMADLRRASGRPMVHDLRAMLDAIGYVLRNGIEWRALPVDFPPWEAVYAFFQRWSQRGLPHRLVDRLRSRLRVGLGRDAQPSAAIVDSQSVKGAEVVGSPHVDSTAPRRSTVASGIWPSTWRGSSSRWWSPPPTSVIGWAPSCWSSPCSTRAPGCS